MEPITHFLTGACLGRAGLNRKTAYATVTAALAAEAADLDVFWSLAGPVESLKHHRGITHTVWAVPVVAGVTVAAVWLFDRWRCSRKARKTQLQEAPAVENAGSMTLSAVPGRKRQAVRWGWLYATAFLAASSHLLLDWTNNYGLRPFFPFNPHWYAGSFVFIAEPVLWALLLAAFVAPWLFGLADQEIGARRKGFRGRGWAIFALVGMVALWGWRWTERVRAEALLAQTQVTREPVRRMDLEPYPMNPFRWHAILETQSLYQTAEVDAWRGTIESDAWQNAMYKPQVTPAVEAAKRTPLGQVYLDWGSWAVVRDMGPLPVAGMEPPNLPPGRIWNTVKFTDLRFNYSFLGRSGMADRSPLTGWVYIVDGREEAGEALGEREQR